MSDARKRANPTQELITAVSDVDNRLKVLETRYFGLRKKGQSTEQNMVDMEKTLDKEIAGLNTDILDIKTTVHDLKEKLELFTAEFAHVANKYELKTLATYLQLWQPMNFVTKQELKDVITQLRARLEVQNSR